MENLFIGNCRNWIKASRPDADHILSTDFDIPESILRLMIQRGINAHEEIEAFINPSLERLHDPFLLDGMDCAVDRILRAISDHEKVLIYGDYDVDGVSATSILVHFFKNQGVDISFYIPDRVDEGYGISDAAVDYIIENGFDLVITVDCGITARFQVEAIYERSSAQNKRIELIITDHHQCHEGLVPDALAVINPHIPDSSYPFKQLCGAGIALKLVQAVGIRLNQPDAYRAYLDLAALATIADVVDLKCENRIIVKYGLEKIKQDSCLGISSLLAVAGGGNDAVDSFKISYMIAPRVNAAGRMGDAKRAVALFTTSDCVEAARLAKELDQTNVYRQEVQDDIFKQAISRIENDSSYARDKVIVVWGEGWHHGVIGIVASKLVDRYHKPAFVLSIEGDKAVGSGRSIEGFNLFHCMEALSSLLIKFGGHSLAGGLTVMTEDIAYLRTRINAYAENIITDEMILSAITINDELEYADINLKTAKALSRLEPFGQGNPIPIFMLRGVTLEDKKLIGNGKHLRLKLGLNQMAVDGVYFGKGDFEPYLQLGDRMDIVFNLEVNCWQGREYLQLRLLDIRLEEPLVRKNRFLMEAARRFECLDCDNQWLYNGIIEKVIKKDDILVSRDDLIVVYKYIMRQAIEQLRIADLFHHARIIERETGKTINFYKLILALFIFDELELISFSLNPDGSYKLSRYQDTKKVSLDQSELYAYLTSTLECCG
jgi:single-stranded-DNA-specific exonuclease